MNTGWDSLSGLANSMITRQIPMNKSIRANELEKQAPHISGACFKFFSVNLLSEIHSRLFLLLSG